MIWEKEPVSKPHVFKIMGPGTEQWTKAMDGDWRALLRDKAGAHRAVIDETDDLITYTGKKQDTPGVSNLLT